MEAGFVLFKLLLVCDQSLWIGMGWVGMRRVGLG